MRIKCQIRVINNNNTAKGLCAAGGKNAQATLFVAKTTNGSVLLVYCTARDKQGIKHRVKDNVVCIFGRYIHEGKATIQLKDPPINICVSHAQPSELKILLMAVKLANKGDSLGDKGILSSLVPARTKNVKSPTTKMIVLSRQDYPFALGFPTTLKNLTVSQCDLSSIDSRIIALKTLVELNLSSNNIQVLPETLSSLSNLLILDLSNNEIERMPTSTFLEDSKLTTLNLSHNKLKGLPNSICMLKKLWHLNVSHNCIRCLPRHIHQLRCLRTLKAAHNNLLFLPVSILQLQLLSSIDIFNNDFSSFHNSAVYKKVKNNICKEQILSLQHLCGQVVKNEKVVYNTIDYIPYPLIHFLNSALQCQCRSYCFEENIQFIASSALIVLCPSATSVCMSGSSYVYFQVGVCSTKCLNLWKRYLRSIS